VVDLSGNNYFGSIVIGSLVQLGNLVREKGGRIALCGASRDMQDVLRLLKLDSMWEMFPSRRAALRAIARIPVSTRLWRTRKWLATLAIFAACVAAYWYIPRPRYERHHYSQLSSLWREYEQKSESLSDEAWAAFAAEQEQSLEPIILQLMRRGDEGRASMEERMLLFAARDHWIDALDRKSDYAQAHRRMVQYYLRSVEAALEGRMPPIQDAELIKGGGPPTTPRSWSNRGAVRSRSAIYSDAVKKASQ
jgi:hypothetical protein